MLTVLDVLKRTEGYFGQAGIERPRVDAEWLLARVLGCRRVELYLQFERPLEEATLAELRPLVKRRASREPLQYILGTTEFYGLEIRCDRRALIPRPETEQLADEVARAHPRARKVLDLGTGTGVLGLAFARALPEAEVVATDASSEALNLARENAQANGLGDRVTWREGRWFEPLGAETFDVIVANPPYLTEAEWRGAEPEVRDWEPRGALVAAEDGLADLRAIIGAARAHLNPGGVIALETGIAHHEALTGMARELAYGRWESRKDYHGRPRFFWAWR